MGTGARSTKDFFTSKGVGLGLRAPHFAEILEDLAAKRCQVPWFEATSENYMGIEGGAGGRPLRVLETVRSEVPVALHGVSMSIGTVDPLDRGYLARLKSLVDRVEPFHVSDHLCWTGVDGENLHDLLPLPYTEEALDHLVPRVLEVQEFLGRRMLLENVSSYLSYGHSSMTEWEFLSELCRRADCGLLLDVNNIYVSSVNHGFDAMDFLNGIPPDRVGYVHLAGHSEGPQGLIDTHDHPVAPAVWSLYSRALARIGTVSTLVEWDDRIPSFQELLSEAGKARGLQRAAIREALHEERL
jgi:uncharacterized protein (UPF0276 family)